MTDWSPTSSLDSRPPLHRSTERTIAGVAGGIAEQFSFNPIIARVLFGVFALAGGAGFLLYLGLWVLIPGRTARDGDVFGSNADTTSEEGRSNRVRVLGAGLLGLAVLTGLFTLNGFDFLRFLLISSLFGGIVLLNRRPKGIDVDREFDVSSPGPSMPATPTVPVAPTMSDPPPPSVPPPPSQLVIPSQRIEPEEAEEMSETKETGHTTELPTPDTDTDTGVTAPPPPASPSGPRPHWAVAKTAEETSLTSTRAGPSSTPIASITLAAILAVLGVALVLNTLANIFVGAVTVSGISMALVGLAVGVTSYRGATFPLVPIAMASMVALAAAPSIDHGLTDGIGSKDLAVGSTADLQPRYVVGVGQLVLDLRRLELTEDTTIDVEVGTGWIEIRLPQDLITEIHAESTVGYVEATASGRGGINRKLNLFPSVGTDTDSPTLFINATTTIGSVEVYRG